MGTWGSGWWNRRQILGELAQDYNGLSFSG